MLSVLKVVLNSIEYDEKSQYRKRAGAAGTRQMAIWVRPVSCWDIGLPKLPASKHGESERQLKGQENGLNSLTVEEYLENAANPVKRDPAFAKAARSDLELSLKLRFQDEFLLTMNIN